jgi:uncharacterized damage-inducible protein DinB
MAEQQSVADMLESLQQTQEALLRILDQASLDTLYRRPADDAWTLAQVLAHITEAREFYAGETQKVLETPGVKMGRTPDYPARLQAIADHGNDPPAALRERLIASYRRLVEVLQQMTDEDLSVTGEHVKYGPQSLGEFVQRFIVEHDRVHVEQAEALLTTQGDRN